MTTQVHVERGQYPIFSNQMSYSCSVLLSTANGNPRTYVLASCEDTGFDRATFQRLMMNIHKSLGLRKAKV